MEKVIPPGLNYADIKPEAIENQIRIVKFTPIATITQAQPNDIVRFHLQGNGFYDPYSAYIRIQVQVDDLPAPTDTNCVNGKFLDRSAHSLFSRLVIRSQGSELERIEQYDVMAAMINDMIYSQEQRTLHHYEGFASQKAGTAELGKLPDANIASERNMVPLALPYLMQSATTSAHNHFADVGVWNARYIDQDAIATIAANEIANCRNLIYAGAFPFMTGAYSWDMPIGIQNKGQPLKYSDYYGYTDGTASDTFGKIYKLNTGADAVDNLGLSKAESTDTYVTQIKSPTTLEFCLPIYSGIIGVLMPEKKLLPMSLLPLEIEFTMNPYAFYPVGTLVTNRRYKVTRFEIWSHTLFFEQELHRSLEAVVAETGIFIHYNSFYLTPINTYNNQAGTISQYNQLGVYLKSINSIHWVYLYNSYEADNGPRKLHFVCHNLTQLQLRNGMELTPSEPIIGQTGGATMSASAIINQHAPFLIETYKAWNKMHDPLSDGAITQYNYNLDNVLTKCNSFQEWITQSFSIGRCQYGISMEGEELGQNKAIITGKKSVMPFDINTVGYKSQTTSSYMLCFLRADFIIYVRPDLVVQRLGL